MFPDASDFWVASKQSSEKYLCPYFNNYPTRCNTNQSIYYSASSLYMLIKIQPDATVCRYLFTAKSLYVFRVLQQPSSGVLKTVTAASGTGHNTGTATSLQRGLIGTRWREVAVPLL